MKKRFIILMMMMGVLLVTISLILGAGYYNNDNNNQNENHYSNSIDNSGYDGHNNGVYDNGAYDNGANNKNDHQYSYSDSYYFQSNDRYYSQSYSEQSRSDNKYIIVVGTYASKSDLDSARLIYDKFKLYSYDVKIIKDSDYMNYGYDNSNVILMGGTCVNSQTAQILNMNFPSCGNKFANAMNIGTNGYVIQGFRTSNNRAVTLIAGHEEEGTMQGAYDFLANYPFQNHGKGSYRYN